METAGGPATGWPPPGPFGPPGYGTSYPPHAGAGSSEQVRRLDQHGHCIHLFRPAPMCCNVNVTPCTEQFLPATTAPHAPLELGTALTRCHNTVLNYPVTGRCCFQVHGMGGGMSRGNPSADSLSSFFDSKLRLVDSAQSTHGANFPGGATTAPSNSAPSYQHSSCSSFPGKTQQWQVNGGSSLPPAAGPMVPVSPMHKHAALHGAVYLPTSSSC
jgi:hypothetical protein